MRSSTPAFEAGRLMLGQAAARNGLVDALVLRGDERRHEAGDRLSAVLATSRASLLPSSAVRSASWLGRGRGRGVEDSEAAVPGRSPDHRSRELESATVERPAETAEEQRVLARVDAASSASAPAPSVSTPASTASSTRFLSACLSASESSFGCTPSCAAASSMTALLSSLGRQDPGCGDRARLRPTRRPARAAAPAAAANVSSRPRVMATI